ncbi:MAG: carbon-nitrogen hydrolase family protein [Deltaproteobacteria bacterium]|nr:carbon-nitrogen hydrolase family protein [Deltaproteobacteria bacterium]
MSTRVAAIQPHAYRGGEEPRNLPEALRYLGDAADQGAQVICFPEGYPGPYSGPLTFDPLPALREAAKAHGVYLVAGGLEPEAPEVLYNTLTLIGPEGEILGRYRRCQLPPEAVDRVLFGRKVQPGNSLEVFRTSRGRVGLLICSEVFSPELCRLLALDGADILCSPVGGLLYELLDTWRLLLRARAAENHYYVVTCQNLYGMEEGIATIAGPEGVLAERRDAGIILADLDLDRLEWLRGHEESLELPKPYRTIPGLLGWRRPELYGPLAEPSTTDTSTPEEDGR